MHRNNLSTSKFISFSLDRELRLVPEDREIVAVQHVHAHASAVVELLQVRVHERTASIRFRRSRIEREKATPPEYQHRVDQRDDHPQRQVEPQALRVDALLRPRVRERREVVVRLQALLLAPQLELTTRSSARRIGRCTPPDSRTRGSRRRTDTTAAGTADSPRGGH